MKTRISIYYLWISKVVIGFVLEETQPTQRNKLLWNLLPENILKPCFNGNKTLILKMRFFNPLIMAHNIVFCGISVKIYKGKVRLAKFFVLELLWRVTENSPAINILHERDLMVYQESPPIHPPFPPPPPPHSEWKIILLFFSFVISYC